MSFGEKNKVRALMSRFCCDFDTPERDRVLQGICLDSSDPGIQKRLEEYELKFRPSVDSESMEELQRILHSGSPAGLIMGTEVFMERRGRCHAKTREGSSTGHRIKETAKRRKKNKNKKTHRNK